MKDKILIIDGNSIINRSYYAMRNLTNKDGFYTGGIYGFTRQILMLMDTFKPKYACIAFDMRAKTFRHNMFEEYKGNRKGMPEELAMQMPVMKEIIDALGIERVEIEGYEADDIIGTVAKNSKEEGVEAIVVTGDKDALQLVGEDIRVFIAKKGGNEEYKEMDVFDDLGVYPNQVIDYKGLSGDSSDNIPGVPRIGPKTAAKLLAQFENLENIYENIDEVKNKNQKSLLETYKEQAMMSKKLATIITNMPVEFDMGDFEIREKDNDQLFEFFTKYNFKSIMDYLDASELKTETEDMKLPEKESVFIFEKDEVETYINTHLTSDKLKQYDEIGFKFFYDKSHYVDEKAIGLAIGLYEGEKIQLTYLNLLPLEDLKVVEDFINHEKISKIGHITKQDELLAMRYQYDLKNVTFDTYIATYLLEPSRKSYDLADICFEYTRYKMPNEEEFLGKGVKKKNYNDFLMMPQELAEYGTDYVYGMMVLYPKLKSLMDEKGLTHLFESVEMPLIKVLADIEFEGFNIDQEELERIDKELTEKLEIMEQAIYGLAGRKFNINSPKQLGQILFEEMGIEPIKKTKTGYSTSHDILVKLSKNHPIAEEVIEYRTYSKLKSTYIDGLRQVINPLTKRVHTSLNQTVSVTGRLSSTDPNLQNIPIRLPIGRQIRKLFIPSEGNILLGADYSQIELRVLAHMSGDETLVNAFNNDLDIHTITASEVFKLPQDEVTSLQRSRAKEVNFGIIYGMGDFGLSESLKITRKEAKAYIDEYFVTYPKVKDFMDEVIDDCKTSKVVKTVLGRIRYVPDISHSNFNLRMAAERIARNTPIQGSAADIIKIAMINVYHALEDGNYKSKMILQVHDELLIDTVPEEKEAVEELLISHMQNAFDLVVPLKVDCNEGKSWYEAK